MTTTTKNRSIITLNNCDLFESTKNRVFAESNGCSVIIPHVCNNIGVFGGGFTGAIDKLYPIVKNNYEMLTTAFFHKNPGHTQFITVLTNHSNKNKLIFANMIAQNGIIGPKNKRPINYAFLVKSMVNIKAYIKNQFDSDNSVELHCPRFGSGLAGGNWSFIHNLIEDIWEDIPVYIYNHKISSNKK